MKKINVITLGCAKNRVDSEHLFVTGCLSERYADELRSEIPEVDEYFGAKNFAERSEL